MCIAPVCDAYVPAAHSVQAAFAVAATDVANEPATQAWHAPEVLAPEAVAYSPAGHWLAQAITRLTPAEEENVHAAQAVQPVRGST